MIYSGDTALLKHSVDTISCGRKGFAIYIFACDPEEDLVRHPNLENGWTLDLCNRSGYPNDSGIVRWVFPLNDPVLALPQFVEEGYAYNDFYRKIDNTVYTSLPATLILLHRLHKLIQDTEVPGERHRIHEAFCERMRRGIAEARLAYGNEWATKSLRDMSFTAVLQDIEKIYK